MKLLETSGNSLYVGSVYKLRVLDGSKVVEGMSHDQNVVDSKVC